MTDSDFDSGRVKAFREARGLSQQQLAAEIGVDQATVSRIENGAEPSKPVRRLLSMMMAGDQASEVPGNAAEAAE
ncbi:XRE family transcriptional regulator [Mesorhizobium sp. M1A.F.Ca.IN.020.06.1.1]|uniref:helix-turn-helix domain-containing protein n=1 Tax=unclassified Mesorhizobium TaxID=325217 RepID=UPI000FCB530E|nr:MULTISPECIES: helix-turn-helix transcriptional regulator [unclassified Mesorhizobium]RUV17874.1 XRE family transcriptional regulator [Mesorhizobium sp. M1A.F.Ca.IN.022.04.1.1]RUV84338.1 XRE family transcriptional regulator [Mesorhizobium sp. M1A.F.Ca.IN.020.32.1.1]RUW13875.1 XRE family transcriptional regulator [Mesorhizobium sp. M1A.F.Ca.IN.022.05.2.1]RUW35430.1 XRE family transcriptional regulator [Mesorhizobium sp. M1A.F.Ca.IN.020.06.1.1]RWF81338.1 MAG: XRE family transcriptional regulat